MQYIEINKRLERLIRQAARSGALPWLTEDFIESLRIESGVRPSAPVREILEIYSVRARFAKKKGIGVAGYDWLLKNLGERKDDEVAIIPMRDKDEIHYFLFIDPKEQYLYGILRFPKTN